tara:strand:+ start:583 stop:1101 length:519 start_codon:yes stop_codon:yes gene_type:complete
MKTFILLLIIPFLSFGQISFEEIENKNDCHACPGFLVVTKNNLKDTITIGSWGKVNSDYTVKKIGNSKYIVLNSSYFMGGALEEGVHIYSTGKKDFLKEVFSKIYTTQSATYERIENSYYNIITSIEKNISYEFEGRYLNIKLDTMVFKTTEPEETGRIISNGVRKEKYLIK